MKPWRTLVLVYRHVDAPALRRTMPADEHRTNVEWIRRMPSSVELWSEGNARLDAFDVVDVDRPLRHLSDAGAGRLWVAPEDCTPELDVHAPRGRYDCILVLWPADPCIDLCGWGCSVGPCDAAHGAGFSSCASCFYPEFLDARHPEEGFVHEWLHQVEATFRNLGASSDVFPSLHDAGEAMSCRPPELPPHGRTYGAHQDDTRTWQPWYRDYMTGTVRRPDGNGCFGLSPEVWALR